MEKGVFGVPPATAGSGCGDQFKVQLVAAFRCCPSTPRRTRGQSRITIGGGPGHGWKVTGCCERGQRALTAVHCVVILGKGENRTTCFANSSSKTSASASAMGSRTERMKYSSGVSGHSLACLLLTEHDTPAQHIAAATSSFPTCARSVNLCLRKEQASTTRGPINGGTVIEWPPPRIKYSTRIGSSLYHGFPSRKWMTGPGLRTLSSLLRMTSKSIVPDWVGGSFVEMILRLG